MLLVGSSAGQGQGATIVAAVLISTIAFADWAGKNWALVAAVLPLSWAAETLGAMDLDPVTNLGRVLINSPTTQCSAAS
jgi:hypothetical protein